MTTNKESPDKGASEPVASLRAVLQKLCDAANATAEVCNTSQMDEAIAHAFAVLGATESAQDSGQGEAVALRYALTEIARKAIVNK